jgi:hypothetical protein
MTRRIYQFVTIARGPVLAAAAGPVLIVAIGLYLRRDFVLHPVVGGRDMAQFWLPLHCYLRSSLTGGHIPAWSPHTFSGMPFAADPQGGWLNLLTMLLFTTLSCGTALRWLVVIQPILAGVALYWFLREEEVSRPAATVGGLVLCGSLAASAAALTVRFPGALAWTAVLLACTSRYLRADRGSRRVGWLVAAAVAWGQIAASHLGVGLLIGTGALAALIGAKLAVAVRRYRAQARTLALALLPMAPVFAAVNLAWFLPRLALLPKLSLGDGYRELRLLALKLIHVATPPFPGQGTGPAWLIDLSTTPGRYLGGGVLLTSFAGLWSRRHRPLAIAFSLVGLFSYLASLRVVAGHVPSPIGRLFIVDSWLHAPHWMSFGVLLAVAVLGSLGVEAWRESREPLRRAAMVSPGLALWGLFPLFYGVAPERLLLLVVAGAAVLLLLAISADRPLVAPAVSVLVALELMFGPSFGSGGLVSRQASGLISNRPQVHNRLADYLVPSQVARILQREDHGRFMFLGMKGDARALRLNEALTFGLEHVSGYQSVQLLRYWIFVRRLERDQRSNYQYALFRDPSPTMLNLLQVNWLVAGPSEKLEAGATPVGKSGPWTLYRRARTVPRASVVFDWRIAKDADAALDVVARPDFDPVRTITLESDPGLARSPRAPSGQPDVAYVSLGPQAAQVTVRSPQPGIVLVRNVWDDNWHATMDGRSVPLLRADSLLQAVAVPAGANTVVLTYDDPTIGLGLAGSGLTLGALALLAIFLDRRERKLLGGGSDGPPV